MSDVAAPAGWYPANDGSQRQRWWDGVAWTEHYQHPYTTERVDLTAPEGARVYTPWIWVMLGVQVLQTIALLTIDWAEYMRLSLDASIQGQLAALTSQASLVSMLSGWGGLALLIGCAFLDWSALKREGIPRPFHAAWSILSPAVYVIGRAVVARRRAGRGIAVMWLEIAILMFGLVAAIWMIGVIFAVVFEFMPSLTA
ncbi:DUF2510 domain-containing protein [Cryobacterium sp. BB736]|uniref:DUF2510 domain-containing protein n=1 Tax=Cryobacterium sp. BB736 TaxID=2746963 RepID=UPI001875661B|nr:DUF2510 domain-containing protein [Cryobacterium sp. BB736]